MQKGVVIVTGGSRGIGAEIAVASAQEGNDVVIGYLSKEKKALEVVARVEALGQVALAIRADITDTDESMGLLATARNFATDRDKELSTLVLNAAGGLERGRDRDYAFAINTSAPWLLASRFLIGERRTNNTKMRKDIVFVTSNPSHFNTHPRNMLPDENYKDVADSKHEGESILREDLGSSSFGIDHRFLVATADLVDGPAGSMLLNRAYKKSKGDLNADLLAERSAQLKDLIGRGITDAPEFGGAIVSLFMNNKLPHGHTLYMPRPVLGTYVVPPAELPFGLGQDPSMYTFHS